MLKETNEILTAVLYTAPRCKVVKLHSESAIMGASDFEKIVNDEDEEL